MKLNVLLPFFLIIITSLSLLAQAPQAFNYQAVARDNAGEILAAQAVSFQISILKGSAVGEVVYTETHAATTNNFGLVNLEIGNGTAVSGSFPGIDWGSDNYFLEMAMDPTGGTDYQLMGTSQLLSVPYALHSGSTSDSTRWLKNNDDLFYNKGNVGIGTSTPAGILDIGGAYHFPGTDGNSGQVLKTNGTGALGWGDDAQGTSSMDSLDLGGPSTAAEERWFLGMEIPGIPGSWDEVPECVNCSQVFDLEWSVYVPSDLNNGWPTGVRIHNMLTLYKNIDRASVPLIQNLVEGETIGPVTLKFYRYVPGRPSEPEEYYSIKLLNVRVVDFHNRVYHTGNASFAHMDKVSFVYETIIWKWIVDGIEFQDTWFEPRK